MSRSHNLLPPELHALLEWESEVPPLPPGVRARAIARARAALAVGQTIPFAASGPVPRIRLALAIVVAVAAAAAAGTLGYALGGSYVRAVPASEATTSVVSPAWSTYTAESSTPVPSAAARDAGLVPRPSQAEPEPEELLLLGEARSAVADHDFAAALVHINEHARRFESGLLSEEREALRVKALSGLGRTEEAQRAAGAFEREFPHSVLVRAVRRMAAPVP